MMQPSSPAGQGDAQGAPSGQVLLVTNAYPSSGALYRNGFIHRRVLGYREAGISVEVYYLHPPVANEYSYVFDGVHVTVGNAASYARRISRVAYRTILVHFASPAMLGPIVEHAATTPVLVWIHGFEAEAWHRRWFNFVESAAELRQALTKRETYYSAQNAFMRWLLSTTELNLRVVHVSDWFRRNIVEPDAGVPTRVGTVIPNYIDERLFEYREKPGGQRNRILSIRPYASRKYANDVTIEAIRELSRRPYFKSLAFTIRGEGPLFAETVDPIRHLDNVHIEEGFLRQDDIARLHRSHGTFLAPTRFDSQGVSMCEAMASGLVPVSTNIAAIPEFVDNYRSGLLAEPEDPVGIADCIEMLHYNEELYSRLSATAASSVRQQCGFEATIGREIELIGADT